ncbi:MAG: glycoside hydrolase family 2 TIM barrel-domain containing protein [Bryobacteraceae bacterium]
MIIPRLSFCLALLAGFPAQGPTGRPASPRVEKTINRDWTFQYFPEQEPDLRPAQPGYDDSRWPAVAIPHTWLTYETTGDLHPFIRSASERDDSYWWYGWGWYRKRFTIGKLYAGRLIALEFDGVQKYSKVYVNGVLAGEHKGGYTSFSVDITRLVRLGEPNLLAVQVSNRRDDPYGRIPPMTAGNFDVYGGIYRDVRLVIRDRLHIPFQGSAEYDGGTFVTTPEVSQERGVVDVRTWVRNDYPGARVCALLTTIRDADGKTVAQISSRETIAPGTTHEFAQRLSPVANPHLWSPDSPYLYQVSTQVRDGDRLSDSYTSPLGFRWYRWNREEKRLYLNGSKLVLRGINRHQEYPWLGDAMPKWIGRQDLEDIRHNMGLYFQRTVHYPNDPYVYDLSDRLGIITIEEIPNIKDIAFGRDVQRSMLQEAIRRDRNHPSIFIWSIGNETNQPADSAWAREEDGTRIIYLRRGENGGKFVELTDQDLPIENLLRCTIRGWYTSDDRDFGPETRNPASGQVTGTELWQHQADVRSGTLTNENVVVWLYADHGADREYLNSPLLHINPKGWTDAYRFPKYVYYLWQANFTAKPMAFILPHYWREQYLGQRKPIVVDSNCDEVVLKVNGTAIGTRRPSAANNHSVTFENVEIRRGTISVEGRKGEERITYSLTMAGKPARLVLKSSADRIPADRSGIAVLSADIVDAAGVHVYGANPPLTWTLTGPATLVGPAVYQTDTQKNGAMEGTMYIDAPVANLVRSTATPGAIRARISAPGLEPAEVTLASVAPPDDRVDGITEPPVAEQGRTRVTRVPGFRAVIVAAKASTRNKVGDDSDSRPDSSPDPPQPAPNSRDETRRRIKSTLFVPDPLPPLQAESYGQFEPAPGVGAERVSYATGYGLRVPAIVYRPKQLPASKMPGLIVVNGHGGDKYSWYSFYAGILYAQAGAVVLTYDPIGEGERNAGRKSGTRQHDQNVDPPEMARRMSGLMITDVMQAVSYLSGRPGVDAKRLAALGYSMGSFVLGIACAIETRLNSCVLAGGGNLDGPGGYWDSSSKKMCQAIPYQSLMFLGDRGAVLYDLAAARGGTFILNGSADDVVSTDKMGARFFEDLRQRTIALHGSDRNVFDFAFVPGGGHRPYFLTRAAALWLERHLDFPSWTPELIARMPETHIGEWAAKNHVSMDKLYATELREGGTIALGAGIPAVAHDLLNSLPLDGWERDKNQYVYETWLKEAGGLVR